MRPTSLTATATGATDPIIVDRFSGNFSAGIYLTSTGATQATLQITGDNILGTGFTATTANWISVTGIATTGGNNYGHLTTPCIAVRANVTSYATPLTLTVIKDGTGA